MAPAMLEAMHEHIAKNIDDNHQYATPEDFEDGSSERMKKYVAYVQPEVPDGILQSALESGGPIALKAVMSGAAKSVGSPPEEGGTLAAIWRQLRGDHAVAASVKSVKKAAEDAITTGVSVPADVVESRMTLSTVDSNDPTASAKAIDKAIEAVEKAPAHNPDDGAVGGG